MNSVMEIGENIIFLKDGLKEWEGTKEDLFNSQNSNFDEFVYSSEILKKVKEFMKK
jgi:phospholipid/cholesterol/gamma-HCH transport system ATP-binding protein